MIPTEQPTRVRYIILALTVVVAVLLYLDRFCLGFVLPFISEQYGLSDFEINFLVGAFFYTYAFGQIAGGYLSDRYGTRLMLASYLAIWSVLTGMMGYVDGFVMLVLLRFGCGLFEAGAYPACAGLIRRWIPYHNRGFASGIISIGGRLGGTVAPVVTAYLMFLFMPISHPSLLKDGDLMNPPKLARDVLSIESGKNKLSEVVKAAGPQLQLTFSPVALGVFRDVANLPQDVKPSREQILVMNDAINLSLKKHDLFTGVDLAPIKPKLNNQAHTLLADWETSIREAKVTRLNRFILEAMFPDGVRKLLGESWQPVLLIYGSFGVLLAVFFYFFFRDTPREHFLVNEAEAAQIEAHEKKPLPATGIAIEEAAVTDAEAKPMPAGAMWLSIVTNVGLWASSLVQFGTNFGWIFLGSMLPLYLQRVYAVPEIERGWMASAPFFASLPMMIVGGLWTDWMTLKYGKYWGRCFPLASTRFVAGAAFVACVFLDDPWAITAVFCVFSVFSDMGLPAVWAYNLDVGGRNVGLVLGWGNMWGNLGAAVSPMLLGFVLKRYVDFDSTFTVEEAKAGYNAVFLTCAAVFVFIGFVSFFVDATKRIDINEKDR